jgi:hypothetical protein
MRSTLLTAFIVSLGFATSVSAAEPIDIGSRRELFVDWHLIAELKGDAELYLHQPQPHDVALVTDKPWEGNTCAYYTIFQDGDRYRMYYRGSHYDEKTRQPTHREVTCYAESKDGIHWTKPDLGLFEFDGSKQNNIVWDGIGTHCFAVFKDENPDCQPQARYKAIARGRPRGKPGLYIFQSPDGLHWSQIGDGPVITQGAFDSQNLAFWDPHAQLYREYHRTFVNGVRAIITGTSTDYVHWTDPVLLDYGDAPRQHLYTNAIRNYFRAPHILLGFPTRYLPNEGSRVEPTLMASRDGRNFHRWLDPVIPEDAPKDRDGNRSNYMAWGVVQLPHSDRELSVYATEAYYTGPDSRIRRFSYRVDGFVSLRGSSSGGELITKPITFKGKQLTVNYATTKSGNLRVELQDAGGNAIDGFRLADCNAITGDEIDQTVKWQGKTDVSSLSGKAIRICFAVKDGDLYSFRFGP